MRTRSRNDTYSPPLGKLSSLGTTMFSWLTPGGSWMSSYGLYGLALPPADHGPDNPSPYPVLIGRKSDIVDELPNWERIGYVNHIKAQIPARPVNYYNGHYSICLDYDPSNPFKRPLVFKPMMTSWISSGYRPQIETVLAVASHDQSYNVLSSNARLPVRVDPDPSRIVGAIMSRLVKFNGATYLAEMKDLPELARWLWKHGQWAKILADKKRLHTLSEKFRRSVAKLNNGRKFTELSDLEKERTLARLFVKAGSDAYLGTIFGLLPTIGETTALVNEILGQRVKRTEFSVSVPLITETTEQVYLTPSPGVVTSINVLKTNKCTARIGARVKVVHNPYTSPQMVKLSDTLNAYLGYNPARPAWAVVPFSFVVDWLYGTDVLIDAAYLSTTKQLDIHYWKSAKLERSWTANSTYMDSWSGLPSVNLDTGHAGWPLYKTVEFSGLLSQFIREETPSPLGDVKLRVPKIPSLGKCFTLALIAIGFTDR